MRAGTLKRRKILDAGPHSKFADATSKFTSIMLDDFMAVFDDADALQGELGWGRQGFFPTTFPFCQMQIGVPCIFAVFRARRAAAGMAPLTDSKNRLSSNDGFVFLKDCGRQARRPFPAWFASFVDSRSRRPAETS
jgi:hypothetical protein